MGSPNKKISSKMLSGIIIFIIFLILLMITYSFIKIPYKEVEEQKINSYKTNNSPIVFENSDYDNNVRFNVEIRSITNPYGIDKGLFNLQLDATNTEMPPHYFCTPSDFTEVKLVDAVNIKKGLNLPEIQLRWQLVRWKPNSDDRSYLIVSYPFPLTCLSASNPNNVVNDPFLRSLSVNDTPNRFEFIQRGDQLYYIRSAGNTLYWRLVEFDGEFENSDQITYKSKKYIEYVSVEKATLWYVGGEVLYGDNGSLIPNYLMPKIRLNEWWAIKTVTNKNLVTNEPDTFKYSYMYGEKATVYGSNTLSRIAVSDVEFDISNNEDDDIVVSELSNNKFFILSESGITRFNDGKWQAYKYRLYYKFNQDVVNIRVNRGHWSKLVGPTTLRETYYYYYGWDNTIATNEAFYISRGFNIYPVFGTNELCHNTESCGDSTKYYDKQLNPMFFQTCKNVLCNKNMRGVCAFNETIYANTPVDSKIKQLFRLTTIESRVVDRAYVPNSAPESGYSDTAEVSPSIYVNESSGDYKDKLDNGISTLYEYIKSGASGNTNSVLSFVCNSSNTLLFLI